MYLPKRVGTLAPSVGANKRRAHAAPAVTESRTGAGILPSGDVERQTPGDRRKAGSPAADDGLTAGVGSGYWMPSVDASIIPEPGRTDQVTACRPGRRSGTEDRRTRVRHPL